MGRATPHGPRVRGWIAWLALLSLLACQAGGDARLAKARELQQAGRFAASVVPLRALLEDRPEDPEANHRLGVALLRTGQAAEALAPLERAARSDEFALPAGLLFATTALSEGQFEHVIQIADRLLELQPGLASALALRAHAQLAKGDPKAALADLDAVLQESPEQVAALLLKASALDRLERNEEVETLLDRVLEMVGDRQPAVGARACLEVLRFHLGGRGDAERALPRIQTCLERHPAHLGLLSLASQYYDAKGDPERGDELWSRAIERQPEQLGLRVALAHRRRLQGQAEEGRRLLEETAEQLGSPSAWQALAAFHRSEGSLERAVAALDDAIAGTQDPDEIDAMRVAQCELVLALGDLERAEALGSRIHSPARATLVEGAVRLERGEPTAALEALERAQEEGEEGALLHALIGRAALRTGDWGRAMSELRAAFEANPRATDAALDLAQIALATGQNREAAQLASAHAIQRGTSPRQALTLAAHATFRLGETETAYAILDSLGRLPGQQAAALAERAALERQVSGAAEAARLVEESGLDLLDPDHEEALRALLQDWVRVGRAEQALAKVDEALDRNPDRASLHELRGRVLAQLDRSEEARRSFDRGLELDPACAGCLEALGKLAADAGDRGLALELLDRASELDRSNPGPALAAARLSLEGGDEEAAIRRLRSLVERFPILAAPRNDLAFLLAQRGEDLDLALTLAQQALRLQPTANLLDTLGFVHLARGDAATALPLLQRAVEASPEAPSLRYHLALALSRSGDEAAARRELETALGTGPFPEAEAARAELARLETQ